MRPSGVLRTRRLCLRSRPSDLLLITTVTMIVLGVALPLTPGFNQLFGFEDPDWTLIGFSLALVLVYALVTELTKRLYYRTSK